MKSLLDNSRLEQSSIVANSLMNRERQCVGGNSYQNELSFEIVEFLQGRIERGKQGRWLDLCCGEGKALIEAAKILAEQKVSPDLEIIGIDLVPMFAPQPPGLDFLKLIESSFENFRPNNKFDLITCVHGLHYIGDKLSFLEKTISWLNVDGIFLANLDLSNFRFGDGKSAGKTIVKELRNGGFEYNSKKHLIICKGGKKVNFNLNYLGADDTAGPNYTGQAVVNSYYAKNRNSVLD
jgi:SAM-dependent methyltransferase